MFNIITFASRLGDLHKLGYRSTAKSSGRILLRDETYWKQVWAPIANFIFLNNLFVKIYYFQTI